MIRNTVTPLYFIGNDYRLIIPAARVTVRDGGRGGAKAGDKSGSRALLTLPPNWTEPRATALTNVELSLTNLIRVKGYKYESGHFILSTELPGHKRPGAAEESVVRSSYNGVEVARNQVARQIADGAHGRFDPLSKRSSSFDHFETVADVSCN